MARERRATLVTSLASPQPAIAVVLKRWSRVETFTYRCNCLHFAFFLFCFVLLFVCTTCLADTAMPVPLRGGGGGVVGWVGGEVEGWMRGGG